MALLIDNDAAERLLETGDTLDAIEEAFIHLGGGDAAFYPLAELISPTAEQGDYYAWGSHIGAVRDPPRLAFRFKSDVLSWAERDGNVTREKFNVEPGTYMGFILLFDTRTGELLGLLNDGVVQHARVGATAGVACDRLAREDAATVGVLGSGGMARTYVEAFCHVRDIETVTAYSPTERHREAFAEWVRTDLDVEATAVDDPEAAVTGVDIAATCTDASQPVYEAEWLSPGTFLVNVRNVEIPAAAVEAADRRIATTNRAYRTEILGSDEERAAYEEKADHGDQDTDFPTLGAVLAGNAPGRRDDDESIFFDNRAVGIQFAAVADLVYERAVDRGLGTAVPLEWFQQGVRN